MRIPTSLCAAALTLAAAAPAAALGLEPAGVWRHGSFGKSASEIAAYDPTSKRLFVVNGEKRAIDVLDISNPDAPKLVQAFDLKAYGAAPNSVAVKGGVVAAALDGPEKTRNGKVVFFRASDLAVLGAVEVGPIPDMLTFTPDGKRLVVVNEGEPNDAVTVDPAGSVAVIDVSAGWDKASVRFADFGRFAFAEGMKRGRPGASFADAAEPEYAAVSADGRTAWVTLQETNAVATVDLESATVVTVRGLGFKSYEACPIDASDKDGKVDIRAWKNVVGMYQPDAIAAFQSGGATYLVTANEGDAQAWGGFNEEKRVSEVKLDAAAFPQGAAPMRLKTTSTMGDEDGDGDVDRIYSLGARSISVWDASGALVADTCDDMERRTLEANGSKGFNANNDEEGGDARSDDKGPEPEGLAVAVLDGRTYAFVGLERTGGVIVYDLTDPKAPAFVTYAAGRDYRMPPTAPASGDSGPEGVLFIPAADAPGGEPLLAVTNEASGTTRLWRIRP